MGRRNTAPAFTQRMAGGRVQFIAAPAFGTDGHQLFSGKGMPIREPYVDDFLARQNLTLVDHLLPIRDDAAVHYPRGLSAQGKEAFTKYLDGSQHKAFVMSSDGHFGWRTGRKTVDEAVEGATDFCRKAAPKPCFAVMTDEDPVE